MDIKINAKCVETLYTVWILLQLARVLDVVTVFVFVFIAINL